MDESERRRERLKAMRNEADASSTTVSTSASHRGLSNPFVESIGGNFPEKDGAGFAPRFDFYTDPMAAYSGNRTSNAGYRTQGQGGHIRSPSYSASPRAQIPMSLSGSWNPEMIRTPAPQFHNNNPPNQRIYHAPPGLYHGPGPYGRPLLTSPSPSHQGTPQWFGRGPRPDSWRGGSSIHNPGRGMDNWGHNNMGRSGRGGGYSPNTGRGRGDNTSPGSACGGGRGRGSHDNVTAQDRPDRFYQKSMVEDPWKFLEPVLWRGEDNWMPKSISVKKPRASEAPPSQSNSQFNLAEYLAASFNEAVNESENA